ncbi:MAG: autotransporter domain-containing protein [Alphaproteobacteria bacterium]|nr:autotransporter domain-containing protein [Alphaproteobacteria bacterium]
MRTSFHRSSILLVLSAALLCGIAVPASATIVYTNGQNRATPITTTETLQVNNFDEATQSGAITGSGTAITKTGSGALTLSGANTYTGDTNVNHGILKLGANFVFSRTSVTTISTGATLDFDGRSEAINLIHLNGGTLRNGLLVDPFGYSIYFFPQVNSTGGTIENISTNYGLNLNVNSGTTNLVGVVTGEATVNGGTLNLANLASWISYSSVVYSGGIVDYGGTTHSSGPVRLFGGTVQNGILNGPWIITSVGGTINQIGGAVNVNILGTTTTLHGANSYSGPTYIATGNYAADPQANQILYGNGALLAGAENTLSPNSDVYVTKDSTLDLGGFHQTVKSLTLNISIYQPTPPPTPPQSILIVGLTDAAPALTVMGNAILGGRLILNLLNSDNPQSKYTVIKAGSITGEFTSVVTSAPTGFTFGNVMYNPTDVTISLTVPDASKLPATSSLTTTTSTSFDSGARASDVMFDHLGDTGSSSDAGSDLTFTSLRDTTVTHSENIQGMNALAKALPAVMKRNNGWFKAIGNLGSVSSNSSAAGYETQTGGFMFGVDRKIEKGLRFGAAGGYEHTGLTGYAATRSEGEANTVRFALYGSKVWDDIALDGQMGYAHHDIDNARYIAPAIAANSNHAAHELSTGLHVSKRMKLNGFGITPRVGANYAYVYEDAFSESGAGISNISVASRANNLLRLYTGLNFTAPAKKIGEYAFIPNARVKYSYDVFDASNNTQATIIGVAASLQGVSAARHTLTLGMGFDVTLDETFSAFATYDVGAPIGNRFDQTFAAGLKFTF